MYIKNIYCTILCSFKHKNDVYVCVEIFGYNSIIYNHHKSQPQHCTGQSYTQINYVAEYKQSYDLKDI